MSNFDLKKFLVENKLTTSSRLQENINTPGFDAFADEVEALFPGDDPRQDKLLDVVHRALIDGDLTLPAHGGESYSKQVHDLAQNLGMLDEVESVEEVEAPVEEGEEIVDENENINKYLTLESPEDIVREIESDIRKITFEAKMKKLKEVIEAMDSKLNSLEEDSNLQGFVNTSKLKEMKRTLKKLRSIDEKYGKEYDKKYSKD